MVAAIAYPIALLMGLQDKLKVVADADVDWKTMVIIFSTSVYLLETYLTSVLHSHILRMLGWDLPV